MNSKKTAEWESSVAEYIFVVVIFLVFDIQYFLTTFSLLTLYFRPKFKISDVVTEMLRYLWSHVNVINCVTIVFLFAI